MLGSSEERDEFRRKVIEELGSRMEEVRRVTDPSGSKVKLVGVFGSSARGN